MMLRRILAGGGTALAAAAMVAVPAAPAQAAECHFRVAWDVTAVWDLPTDQNIYKLKNKYRGDIVGPYCATTVNEGQVWRMVDTDAAPDKYGWMKDAALVRVS
jgi:hypothetical protein